MKKGSAELVVKYWLDISKEDLIAAEAMLKAHRYTWCAFICQQALEKCLKAGYVKMKKTIPPYIHKLERLCQVLKIELPWEILKEIIKIDKYYIVARYPAYKKMVNISNYKIAKKIFQDTKEIYKWLLKELKLQKL